MFLHTKTFQLNLNKIENIPCNARVEVNAFIEGINFDRRLARRRERSLGTLASSAQTAKSSWVGRQVFLVFAVKFLDKVINHSIVKVLSA